MYMEQIYKKKYYKYKYKYKFLLKKQIGRGHLVLYNITDMYSISKNQITLDILKTIKTSNTILLVNDNKMTFND